MDLNWSEADIAFRDEMRRFIEENFPADIREKMAQGRKLEKADYVRWQKILHERGWMAPAWPQEFGGTGWPPVQRYIFQEELARAQTPRIIPFGVTMVGPVIYTFGSQAQKDHYLPRILSSEDWWCQGYSEPGAGSDLASLSTRAVRDGDSYIVNGTKTWTTYAQYADKIFCLVRTDPNARKPQEGISFLLIDMHQPGVEVRPIVTMDGSAEINTVFLTDVKVPVSDRVGEENKGWTYAKFLLGHERTGIAAVGRSKVQLEKLRRIAAEERSGGHPLLEDSGFREKLASIEIDLTALEYTELRSLCSEDAQRAPGPEASILKIRGTEIQQALSELLMEAVGYYGMPYVREALDYGWNEEPIGPDYAPPLAPTYFNWRKASIYGGSNEIQKGVIAKMVLGL